MAFSLFAKGTMQATGTFDANHTVPMPAGTLTGKLLLLFVTTDWVDGTVADISGFTRLTPSEARRIHVFGKIGTSSESSVTADFTGSATSNAWCIAVNPESGRSWPAIGSVFVKETYAENIGSGAAIRHAAHTADAAGGNCLVSVGVKYANLSGITITDVAASSGWTECGFSTGPTTASGICSAAEVRSAATTASESVAQRDRTITTWSATANNRHSLTIELAQAPANITVTVDDDTPTATQAIVITKSGGNWNGTPTAELTDNNGAYVAMPALTSVSGAVATLTLGAGDVTNYDDSNATWELIRWHQTLTLRVTDGDGSGTDTIVIQAPVADHFDAQGATTSYPVTGSATSDDSYVHVVSGDGEGLPVVCDLQGSTIPTVARFMCFGISADKWLAYREETFDAAAVALVGDFSDVFTDTNGTLLNVHTPGADATGDGWLIERDASNKAVPTNSNVTIESNKLRINQTNAGGSFNTGVTDHEVTAIWSVAANSPIISLHLRRIDDGNHISLYITPTSATAAQRIAGVGSILDGGAAVPITLGSNVDVRLRAVASGTSIQLYIDEVLVITAVAPAPAATATRIGVYSDSVYPINFDWVDAEFAAAAPRTLTPSDETATPGQTITLTVAAALGGAITAGTLAGVAFTPGSPTTTTCTLTIPLEAEFDAAGAHVATPWYENIPVTVTDGTDTVEGTIQIVANVPANFGQAGGGPYDYAPVGLSPGDDVYVDPISGAGTADPENVDYTAETSSVVRFRARSQHTGLWLAYREEEIEHEPVEAAVNDLYLRARRLRGYLALQRRTRIQPPRPFKI